MSRLVEVYKQLKARRVIRAGVVYLAVFWLLLQVADVWVAGLLQAARRRLHV